MIVVVSCQHFPNDERIYHRQIKTLLKKNTFIRYFTRSNYDLDLSEPGLSHINLSSNLSIKSYSQKVLNYLKVSDPPDFLHIHEPELLDFAKLVKKKFHSKIIYDVHEDLDAMYRTFSRRSKIVKETIILYKSKIEKMHLKFVDHIILANYPLEKTVYHKLGFKPSVIENFPETKYISNFDNNGNRGLSIIYHGHIAPERGISDLIEAMPKVISEIPDISLTILGSFRTEEFEKQLKEYILKNKLFDNVFIKSQIPYVDVWEILNKNSLGIIPFRDNPLTQKNTPTKLFEMMASGCRIIASDLPPIRNYVSKTVHWIIPGNKFSIAKGIIDAFKSINKSDWIEKNRNLIKSKYNWESRMNDLMSLYNSK
ncbi:MAG: hypothetical protein CMG74_05555 [Candidatus Marinimicrobia bacterium]|nr:hypothetical protein [Candidatus Neomarinimicrobiota bacterium]|tara:strand:- start:35355 stop:36461 length:1107 start_codon:yes stop_codon:yes gene_type:complete